VLSARRGACPRSESLLARRARLRRRRRPRMPPPLPSRSARRDARVHCRRRACGDAAFCGAIRRGGSSALSSSRSRRVDPALPLAVGVARSPLAWRRAAGRAAAQSAASSAARRAVLVLASARALEACPAACPPHCLCLYARGDLRPGSELPPPLVPRRGAATAPVVAARAASALPTRGSAGGRHHRRSCTSRGRPSPPRLVEGGGGERSRVCAAAPLSRAPAGLPPPPSLYLSGHCAADASPAADESVALSARQVACPGSEPPAGPAPPALRRLRTPPPLPSHSAQRAAGVRPPPTCSAAMWRSAVRSASVAALSPRPGARRLDLTASPAVGGARSPHPLGDACCRPGRGPVRYARRRVGERRWCSLRRTLWRRAWRRARPRARCTACGPEAMCG